MLNQTKKITFSFHITHLKLPVGVKVKDRADGICIKLGFKLGLGLPIPIAFKFWSILEESSHENLLSECLYG